MGALGYTWWQSSSKVKPMTSLGAVENKTAKTLVVKKVVITAEPQAEKIINSVVTHDTNLKSNNTGAESEVVSPIVPPPSSTIATNVLPPMTKAGEVPVKPILEIKKSLVERRLEVTKNWLFSGQPSTITIQIKSLPTEVKLDGELERISQQIDVDNIYLYQKQQNGHIYNVILYGQFSQRSDALAALNNLPASIKNNRPYLRTLAGINRDVE
jgi:septal ring-binding cell division protein DamX